MSHDHDRDIAIIGMAGRFPGARDLDAYWANLRDGVEGIRNFTDEELRQAGVSEALLRDPRYVKAGSLLEGIEDFDAEFFGYPAREAEILDPQQRLFLEHCWSALEDSGYEPNSYEGLIGVYGGVAWNTYLLSNLTTHRELFEGGGAFQLFITSDKDFMPTRVSYKLNLRGPSMILQTSCSTSLVAVHLACLSLLNYECDLAMAGGVTVKVPQEAGYYYLDGGLASPDGRCRAFDARGAGTVFGSGVGVVVLKRLAEALEDGDTIRAVVRGSAVNNDGSLKVSYTAPSVEGQAEVIAAAQEVAGIDPRTVQYIEAHGTGTSLGDPIEVAALTKVFRETTEDRGFCALGSVKTNIGHLDAAAGVAGLIKTVLALENRQLPPSLHFETPNPAIDFAGSPFFVNAELRPWEAGEAPRRAGVSSFGVGGTNAHIVLEEAPAREPSGPSRDHHLLVLSARSEKALDAATQNLAGVLDREDAPPLGDLSFTLRCGRKTFRHRRILICQDREDAARALDAREPRRVLTAHEEADPRQRPVVFLLSGQGSQYIGMGRQLYLKEAVFRLALDRCAEILEAPLGRDLRPLLFEDSGPQAAAELQQTALAQPALFAVEFALSELWRSWGVTPTALLGHSLGEYTAACLAGVFSLEEGLALVARRGALMQELPAGAMLAVPLAEEEISGRLPAEISLAALNEPSRSVVSGPPEVMAAFAETLKKEGVLSRRLHTSHAFHSSMMEPMIEAFRQELEKIDLQPPRVPILSNLTGTWLGAEEAADPEYWLRHLRQPVRFSRGLEKALEDGERVLLEVGPGRALATLAARHPARRGQPVIPSLRHPQDEEAPLDGTLEAYGRLWLAGQELAPQAFFEGEDRQRVPLPTYPFERRRYWIEAGEVLSRDALEGVRKIGDIADWFYLPAWQPSLRPAEVAELPRNWLIFEDSCGVAAALRQELLGEDCDVVMVVPGDSFTEGPEAFTVAADAPEDYRLLLEELAVSGRSPQVIVHAGALTREAPGGDGAAFEAAQTLGFFSLLALAQALAEQPAEDRQLWVLGNGLVGVGPLETLHAEKATVLGLMKVLPQEHPQWHCRVIDVTLDVALDGETPEALGSHLRAELGACDDEEVVALRGSQRFLPRFEAVRRDGGTTSPPAPLRPGGSYLLTGGLEGNGYAMATALARSAGANILLLEEDALPSRELWHDLGEDHPAGIRVRRVEALEALGARVEAVTGPLDASGFRRALDHGDGCFGGVHGVIHAAGTVGERTFRVARETGREEAAWQFQPKAHALYALEEVLAERAQVGQELDFCLLLSSLASVLGGFAYGAYAAANSFQEAFVREHNRRGGRPWSALSWDLLQFEDEAEQITELREDLAQLAMSPAEGEEAFLRSLALEGQILVSTADLGQRLAERRRRIDALRGRESEGEGTSPRAKHPRPDLTNAYVVPETELESQLVEIWQDFLGFAEIGVEDNFFELGGDSFVAVQVVSRIQDRLQVELPVAKLYQGLTVRALAELLGRDEESAQAELAEQLDERRRSMDRRREFQQRRRSGRRISKEVPG